MFFFLLLFLELILLLPHWKTRLSSLLHVFPLCVVFVFCGSCRDSWGLACRNVGVVLRFSDKLSLEPGSRLSLSEKRFCSRRFPGEVSQMDTCAVWQKTRAAEGCARLLVKISSSVEPGSNAVLIHASLPLSPRRSDSSVHVHTKQPIFLIAQRA